MILKFLFHPVTIIIEVLIIFLFLSITIELYISKINEYDKIQIILYIYKPFLKYEISIHLVDILNYYNTTVKAKIYPRKVSQIKELNVNEIYAILNQSLNMYKKYKNIFSYISNKIVINSINWRTEIGLMDAGSTAIVTGLVLFVKVLLINFIVAKYNLSQVHLDLVPYYIDNRFSTSLNCIMKIKIGYIICMGISILIIIIRDGDMGVRTSY